jgi:3-oxoacyl-[acyl-carrier-protein] synthase II
MIAGGAEAAITRLSMAGFSNMKALSRRNDEPEKASRPFDRDRDGFVLGEGAGVVILEERERALARGATVYAEIVGYGGSNDAFDMVHPAPGGDGARRAMEASLRDAGLEPADIDHINPHATSTPAGDAAESQAIMTLFGRDANRIPISATKSMTGHLLGGAGAIEAIAVAFALKTGIVPPTINLDNPDPDCDLDYVPKVARRVKIERAMSSSFGFGGHNACLVLAKA